MPTIMAEAVAEAVLERQTITVRQPVVQVIKE
jgi:hypothetical protein